MKYRIRHYTEYSYQDPVSLCYNRLCLTPVNRPHHQCFSSEINIVPRPDDFSSRTDFFGNQLTFFSIYQEHKRLRINSTSIVEVEDRQDTTRAASSPILFQDVKTMLEADKEKSYDIKQYILPSQYIPNSAVVHQFAADCFSPGDTLWKGCNTLMQKIHKSIQFKAGYTTINTPVESVLTNKKGVCQDFAHLMITGLRSLGIPARYVSGYIETQPPPGKAKLVGADASHAWVSVYFPTVGWIEFDPTNCQIPTVHHITVAYGRDYFDVAPIKGIVFSSGQQLLAVKVDVERIG